MPSAFIHIPFEGKKKIKKAVGVSIYGHIISQSVRQADRQWYFFKRKKKTEKREK